MVIGLKIKRDGVNGEDMAPWTLRKGGNAGDTGSVSAQI